MGPRGLGVGIVWWPALDDLCRRSEGLVDVIEAEPEAFWAPDPAGSGYRSVLREALAHRPHPKLLHGVGAPLGGTCPPPDGHTCEMAREVAALRPVFVSEHLSFSRFRPIPGEAPVGTGLLMPPPQSSAGVALAADNILRRRAALGGIPLAIETGASYLPLAPGEWPDGAFLAEVAEAADAGILLDLHNVFCNAQNGRQSVAAFCESLPFERVWEIHLAGGENEAGFYLDTHSGLVPMELMALAAAMVPRLPNLQAIIFEVSPERATRVGLSAIAAQLAEIKDIWRSRGVDPTPSIPMFDRRPWVEPALDPEAWEALLGRAVAELPLPPLDPATAEWCETGAAAFDIYRMLAGERRASAVASAAPEVTRLLLQQYGGPGTRDLLAQFWREAPPGYTAVDEARAFLEFLALTHPFWPGLREAMDLDAAPLDALGAPAGRR